MKKLERRKEGKFLTGLCGGIADYFGVSVAFVRAVAVILQINVWGLIVIYFLASYHVPEACCEQLSLEEQEVLNLDDSVSRESDSDEQ